MVFADLTLIMMTGNRPRMFRDIIEQYANAAPGLTILVGDFGTPESQALDAEAAAQYPDMVRHFVFAPDTPWPERLNTLVAKCETPFVALAADDDLFLADGLAESVAFLREHPDYQACHGVNYMVVPTDKTGEFIIAIDYGFVGRGFESPEPFSRLLSLMYWYQPIYYSVQRTEGFRRIVVPAAVRTAAMLELYTACATVILGKVARLRTPYSLRNKVPNDPYATVYEFSDVVMRGGADFLSEYLPVRDGLAELLRSCSSDGNRDCGRLIDTAFATHIRNHWREGVVFEKLAQRGEIPRDDLPELNTLGIEGEQFAVPAEYLKTFLQPLIARGWPSFG